MTGNEGSGLDLAWKMLNIARKIVVKSPDETMEKVDIFYALAEVSMEREGGDSSISYYLKALATLEHLVEPDHIRILDFSRNICICMLFKLASKFGDAIPYCAKAISVCKSRIQHLKNANEDSLSDKDVCASATEGRSVEFTLEDDISSLARILARLEKKLEELQRWHRYAVKRAVSQASHEQNVSSTVETCIIDFFTDDWMEQKLSFSNYAYSSNNRKGSGVNDKPISDEPSPKRLAADDSPSVNEM